MRKQAGQALILVLIVLAIGALLVVPSLRLTGTALMNTPIVERQTKGLYAADAAQEWVMWSLTQPGFTDQLPEGEPISFNFDVCDVPVGITIVMRAMEGQEGLILATDDKIMPTKTVEPNWVPDWAFYDYTYTISLEQLSSDNSLGLDAIYDLPPGAINTYIGPSEVFIDGEWHQVPGPDTSQLVSKGYLKWPADYNKDTGEGAFSSDPASPNYFYGIRDFDIREVKKLRFKVHGRLAEDQVHCNWVILKPWNTVSGAQAPIKVGGDPDIPGVCEDHDVLEVTKESSPRVILPGVVQEVTYIISITNMYTQTRNIETIVDYLPPGFQYVEFLESKLDGEPIEILDPDVPIEPEDVNGVLRYPVQWSTTQFGGSDLTIGSNKTLELTFKAQTTQEVSGSYYNEVVILLRETGLPPGFADVGVTLADFAANYSWNTGAVIVPAYDSSSEAEGIIINANMALILGGISITSWGVD